MTPPTCTPSLRTTRVSTRSRSTTERFFSSLSSALRPMGYGLSALVCASVLTACGGGSGGTDTSGAAVGAKASLKETAQAVPAGAGVTVRYVRLEATSEVNGNPWSSMAEFNLIDPTGAAIVRTGWKVVADSEEMVGERAPATNAIDGDPNSMWHTQWQGANPKPPHTFTVDLGTSRAISGFKVLPRQVGENGRIAGYKFSTSSDGTAWTLAAQGTFANGSTEATVLLNQAPVIVAVADRMDPAGQAVTQAITATDANGDTLAYSAVGLPAGVAIDARIGLITGTPTAVGTATVTIQVSDGKSSTSASFTWTIAAASGVGITAKYVRLEATSEVNGNPWASVAEFNVLDAGGSVIPRTGWSASADSQEMNGERAPATNAIDGDPNSIWHTQWQGGSPAMPHALTVNLGALKSVGGFKVLPRQVGENGRIAGYRFYTSGDGTNWTLATSGVFPNGSAEATVRLTAAANQPPVMAALTNRADATGQPVTQAVAASDADGDKLTWSATGLPTGLTINAGNGTISGTPSAAGTFAVVVQVSDGRATASSGFTWTIATAPSGVAARFVRLEALSEVNGNPWTSMAEFNVVDATGATLSRAGWTVVADSQEIVGERAPATNAIDGDPNSFWHTQWQGGAPTPPHTFTVNMGATRNVGGFKMLPRQDGVNGRIAGYRFYTSTDGNAWQLVSAGTFAATTAEQTKTIQPAVANQPPVLATVPATRSDVVGASVNLTLKGSDADGDALSYAATGLPTGLQINATTGVISGVVSQPGTYAVTASVSDTRGGRSTQTFTWSVVAPTAQAPAPASTVGASGINPPIVFNATTTAAAGDIVYLQGENFGTSPVVYFDGYPGSPLEIVNRVGTGWLGVQIPVNASGALIVRIANGTGVSAAVKLNAARAYHLDTTQISPGGAFRLFGRNLRVAGSTPSVTVNGLSATIDLNNSDEHMLTLTAPAGLQATSTSAAVVADNGNGSGASQLDRAVAVVASGTGDPFALGVGWAGSFSALSTKPIYPASDSRIVNKAVCNGTHDDAPAIQQAIDLASSANGGVVQLPAGRCAIGSGLGLKSNVVVRGAGKTVTELYRGAAGYPAVGIGIDLAGLAELTLTNGADSSDSMVLKNSSRVFLKNVRIRLGTGKQMYLSDNVNMVVAGTDVEQTGSTSQQGPYLFTNTAGLVFDGNSTIWVTGAPTFGGIRDSYVHASHFTRNATDPRMTSVVHQLTLDFAYRVAVVGNVLDVMGGPIRDKGRNDGETILTEGGGANRTENLGTVGTATATTMTDTSNTLNVDPFGTGGAIPEDYGIAIVSGKGAGQMRHVTAYSAGTRTATVDRAWDVVPDGSSHYSTFVFGLEKALIKGNTLSQTPRGIWLYQTAIRDVDVIGNTMTEGGGIYLRSFQNLATRIFTPIYGVLIKDNKISNSTREWMSYINVVSVTTDGSAFGTGIIGVEVRNNSIVANRPNVTSNLEEYASTEGMMARMPFESSISYAGGGIPRLLGTLFTRNTCTYCDVAVRIGTGAYGTTILNTALPGSASLYTDTSSVPGGEKSVGTIAR